MPQTRTCSWRFPPAGSQKLSFKGFIRFKGLPDDSENHTAPGRQSWLRSGWSKRSVNALVATISCACSTWHGVKEIKHQVPFRLSEKLTVQATVAGFTSERVAGTAALGSFEDET